MPRKDPNARAAYQREYYQRRRSDLLSKQSEYGKTHRSSRRIYEDNWRKKNPSKHTAKVARWQKKNPDKVWAARLKTAYGLTVTEYNALLQKQKHSCALCGRPFSGRPSVDHNHITQQVRGLLHKKCNSLLGFAEDSILRLQQAIFYLEASCKQSTL